MSKYLEDIQGKIISNPINETNTKYPFIDKDENGHKDMSNNEIDYQYMGVNEPVSDIDLQYHDSYRDDVEQLRKKTESWYEALESCLVPTEIEGMSFQPYEFRKEKFEKDEEGNPVYKKIKSLNYFFQDHAVPIGRTKKEFVFRTNKVKFIDDKKRRFIYDRTIHIMTEKEDEDNKITFEKVIRRTFFTQYELNGKNHYYCIVRDTQSSLPYNQNINLILNMILKANTTKVEKLICIDEDGNTKPVETIDDMKKYPLVAGQYINTDIPSSLYNLHNLGWIHPAMIFLNGLAIEWNKIIISVDNIDTFIIVSGLSPTLSEYINDEEEVVMDYLHIPFKVIYTVGLEDTRGNPSYVFLQEDDTFKSVIFIMDKRYGAILHSNDKHADDYKKASYPSMYIDRVICVDDNIKFADFYLTNDSDEQTYLPDVGIIFNRSFGAFCESDYRCKLKHFNFIGFEINEDLEEFVNHNDINSRYHTLKNNDFQVTWHPFNILDIRFNHLYNKRRLFKVFYNTKVLYDQDNILRIKNKDKLSQEYYKYRMDVTANIETYLRELYGIAKKDIGTYVATSGLTKGYKYHYVTPYECFIIYNALQDLLQRLNNPVAHKLSLNEFRDYNLLLSGTTKLNYINGGFIIYDDKNNYFSNMVKESTIYDENGYFNQSLRNFWENILQLTENNISLILLTIDNERHDNPRNYNHNSFMMYSGDSRGKIMPHTNYFTDTSLQLVQEEPEYNYDILKLRFEMSYLNNMEEGATPIDEFIYYLDNENLNDTSNYPVVTSYDKRYTANVLNALAYNVFMYDPNMVLDSIVKMNYMADYIIPANYETTLREECITTQSSELPETGYEYQKDPKFFYNYGYYAGEDNTKPTQIQNEWGLRRNLPEMFYWKLNEDDYTLDSMHLLDEVFDFTYGFDKEYEENLRNGTNYIIGYDADKLEASIKRSIVSISKTGKELKEYKKHNKAELSLTSNGEKRINFVSNNDYIISFNDKKLYAYEDENGNFTFKYTDENGVLTDLTSQVSFKYLGQIYNNITFDYRNHFFIDIDRDFKAHYIPEKTKFNNETGHLEFYNEYDELVVDLIVDKISSNNLLEASRWNISQQDNYVMIFKNNTLYDKYNTIRYTDISFIVELDNSETKDDDVFEFVFFLNANNTIIEKKCDTVNDLKLEIPENYISNSENSIRVDKNNDKMDKGSYSLLTNNKTFDSAIACNTSVIDADNVQLFISNIPKLEGDKYNSPKGLYPLKFDMYSYENIMVKRPDEVKQFNHVLRLDEKVNGVHRVTKIGGGEYVLSFDGTLLPNTNPYKEKTQSIETFSNVKKSAPRLFRKARDIEQPDSLGIGKNAFTTKEVKSIKFNGTSEEWETVNRGEPWLNDATEIDYNGVVCVDGVGQIYSKEIANGIPVMPSDKAKENGNYLTYYATEVFKALHTACKGNFVYDDNAGTHYDLNIDGIKLEHVRPDCAGIMTAVIQCMGYYTPKWTSDMMGEGYDRPYTNIYRGEGFTTYDFKTFSNTCIYNANGSLSNDWEVLDPNSSSYSPQVGDIRFTEVYNHTDMFVKYGVDETAYGFNAGGVEQMERSYNLAVYMDNNNNTIPEIIDLTNSSTTIQDNKTTRVLRYKRNGLIRYTPNYDNLEKIPMTHPETEKNIIKEVDPTLYGTDYNIAIVNINDALDIEYVNTSNDVNTYCNNNPTNDYLVVLNNNVTKTGTYETDNMVTIYIGKCVKEISNSAFKNCKLLRSVIIADEGNLTKIRDDAFRGSSTNNNMTSLEYVHLPENNPNFKEIMQYAFAYCENLSEINLPNSIEQISRCAFYCCKSMTNDIELTNIKGLANAVPNSIYGNGNVFSGSGINSIHIDGDITFVSSGFCSYCKNLKKVTLGSNIKDIGDEAFYQCINLEEINLNNVNRISEKAFSFDMKLTELGSLNNITSIGHHAFEYFPYNKELNLPNVKYIGDYAFRYTNMPAVNIGDKIAAIGFYDYGVETGEDYYYINEYRIDQKIKSRYTFEDMNIDFSKATINNNGYYVFDMPISNIPRSTNTCIINIAKPLTEIKGNEAEPWCSKSANSKNSIIINYSS